MSVYKIVSTRKGDGRSLVAPSRLGLAEQLTGVAQHMLDGELVRAASELWDVPQRSIMLVTPTGCPELHQMVVLDGEIRALRQRLAEATAQRNLLAGKLHGAMPVSHIGAALGVSFTSAKKIIQQNNGGSV